MKFVKAENSEYWVNDRNQFHGEYKRWYDNGQFYVHCFCVDGEIHGEYKAWHENGKIGEHCFYDHGELHGEYKYWHENGKIGEHRFYEHGKIIRDFLVKPFTSDEEKFEFALIHEGRWL